MVPLRGGRRVVTDGATRRLPFVLAALSALLMSVSPATAATGVSGTARVLDGDTLEIGTTRVRLFGIDAPEGAQRCQDPQGREWACGWSATRALERLAKGQEITGRGEAYDAYGRRLAVGTAGSQESNASLGRASPGPSCGTAPPISASRPKRGRPAGASVPPGPSRPGRSGRTGGTAPSRVPRPTGGGPNNGGQPQESTGPKACS
jgi:hypothetical protein